MILSLSLFQYFDFLFQNSEIVNENTVHEFQLSERFIIVVIVDVVENNTKHLNEVFEIVWKNNLLNVNVMIQDQPQFWTHERVMPYQKELL